MRMTAPVVSGTAIVFAAALVWYFRSQPATNADADAAAPVPVEPVADITAPPIVESSSSPDAIAPPAASAAEAVSSPPRSPLPGETPVTPMAQLLADRQQNLIVRDAPGGGPPVELVEGEREFAAEPIDATWAPGAEAKLLATFAQMPGLKLIDLQVECRSTMCRVQLTQPTGTAAPGSPMPPLNILRDETGLTPRWVMAVVDRPGAPLSRSIAYLWREGFAPAAQPTR